MAWNIGVHDDDNKEATSRSPVSSAVLPRSGEGDFHAQRRRVCALTTHFARAAAPSERCRAARLDLSSHAGRTSVDLLSDLRKHRQGGRREDKGYRHEGDSPPRKDRTHPLSQRWRHAPVFAAGPAIGGGKAL